MNDEMLTERALRIADEAMASLIACQCVRADDVGVTYLPTDEDGNITMNERLAEMFGIPKDAFSATLRMRAGVPPVLTVTRMLYRTGQLEPTRQHDRYRLVPDEKVSAGGTAHNGQGKRPAECGSA